MDICRNCHKVIEGVTQIDDGPPLMCPWCMQDARFGPVGRVVNSVRDHAAIVLAVIAIVALSLAWLAGMITS